MSNKEQNTPAAKSGRRSRKASPPKPKPELSPSPQAAQLRAAEPPIDATHSSAHSAPIAAAAPVKAAAVEAAAADTPPIEVNTAPIESDAPADAPPAGTDAAAEPAPVSLQTIAKAYGDLTRKSLEETRCYVEKLRDVRSFGNALEVQTEFAKQALETFVAGSQKIYELHKELAKQALNPMERLMDKPTRDQR